MDAPTPRVNTKTRDRRTTSKVRVEGVRSPAARTSRRRPGKFSPFIQPSSPSLTDKKLSPSSPCLFQSSTISKCQVRFSLFPVEDHTVHGESLFHLPRVLHDGSCDNHELFTNDVLLSILPDGKDDAKGVGRCRREEILDWRRVGVREKPVRTRISINRRFYRRTSYEPWTISTISIYSIQPPEKTGKDGCPYGLPGNHSFKVVNQRGKHPVVHQFCPPSSFFDVGRSDVRDTEVLWVHSIMRRLPNRDSG